MTIKIKILFCFFIIFSAQSLFAQTVTEDALNGIWKMRGYGKVITIDDTIVNSYDVTSISCTLNSQLKRDEISQLGTVKRLDQDLLAIIDGIKTYTLDKISELPKSIEYNETKSEDPNFNFDVLI